MGKAIINLPTEEQSVFYRQLFDEGVFSKAKETIETLLKSQKSWFPLNHSLQKAFGYNNVYDIEHNHNNKYFDPRYKATDKDSCDFLMIGVWVDFKKKVSGLDDVSTAVEFALVWNDVHHSGWINNVTIYFSKSNAYFMKPLCITDLSGTEIINWKWKSKLPIPIISLEKNKYSETSHITSINELKDFISFLIFKERIPFKIHAFERFEHLQHPKTGRPYFNEEKAAQYTRLLDEGYVEYVKLRRKTSYDDYLMSLQRKLRK